MHYMQNCQHDPDLLQSYYAYTRDVFGFDLGAWRQAGCWDGRYVPHSFAEGGRVIANVSAAVMTLQVQGRDVPAVQLGSVGVLPEYRGQGLARLLMEKTLAEYREYPLIFLFAGEAVSDFYPRFGFRRIGETLFRLPVPKGGKTREPARITLDAAPLKRLVSSGLQGSSVLDARGNPSFYWFHLMYSFAECIQYIPQMDIAFLSAHDGAVTHVYDILSEEPVSFADIREYILGPDTEEVRFHFTPDWLGVSCETAPWEQDGMYVMGDALDGIGDFKFPVTAQT